MAHGCWSLSTNFPSRNERSPNNVTDAQSDLPTGFTRWAIVIAACLGTAVFDLTWMIVGVALPHMQGSFSATPDQIAWVMTSFIVGGTMMISVTGWASQRFGRKQIFVFAIIGNTIATAMCGSVDSLEAEVAWRFVQGVLSAPLLALGQAICIDAFPPHRRGFATGIWGSVGVGAVVFAPLVGGYLIEHAEWRWVFYAVVPLGAFATVWSIIFLPKTQPSRGRPLEWLGFGALIVFVGSLQTALSRGERLDWFDSAEIRLQFFIAGFALLVVVYRVLTAAHPVIERRIFADRNYTVSIVFMVLFGGLTTLPVVMLPIMLQQISGYPPDTAGELMLSRGMGTVISLLVVGYLMNHFDPRIVLATGFIFYATTNLFMSTWTSSINESWVVWTNLIQGAASGATYVPIVTLALATLARSLHTEAITFMFLLFNLGSAFGVAAVFAFYTRVVQVNHSVLAEHVMTNKEVFQLPDARQVWDPTSTAGLAELAAEISRQAELIAYLNSFLAIGLTAAAILPLVLLVRKPKR